MFKDTRNIQDFRNTHSQEGFAMLDVNVQNCFQNVTHKKANKYIVGPPLRLNDGNIVGIGQLSLVLF